MTNPEAGEAVRVLAEAMSGGYPIGDLDEWFGTAEDFAAQHLAALPEGWALVNLAALRAEVEGLERYSIGLGTPTPDGIVVARDRVLAILDRLAKPADGA
jgi:hypothetical protein